MYVGFMDQQKYQFVAVVSLLTLLSYCECQEFEVCGTKVSETIDVMWIISCNYLELDSSDFLILKQFLSDMMLWFRITPSNTTGTRQGCLLCSDSAPHVPKYESSVEKAQQNFLSLKNSYISSRQLDKALDYLANSIVASERPNVAVVVTAGQHSITVQTGNAVLRLIEAGWNMLFVGVNAGMDSDKIQSLSSEPLVDQRNCYSVNSYAELKSLEFQKQLARAICSCHNNSDGILHKDKHKRSTNCGLNCVICNSQTGNCSTCKTGYYGPKCEIEKGDTEEQQAESSSNNDVIVGVMVGSLLLVTVVGLIGGLNLYVTTRSAKHRRPSTKEEK